MNPVDPLLAARDDVLPLIEVLIPAAAILFAWGTGRFIERSHFRRLEREEAALADIAVLAMRTLPAGIAARDPVLVVGTAVIAIDYFKAFAGGIRSLIGGRVRGYEAVLERARREALLRLRRDARARGADLVLCVRMETATIGGGESQSGPGGAEVIAYGTAFRTR